MKTSTIDISYLVASALCPVRALSAILAKFPSNVDSPVFQISLTEPITFHDF